MSEALLNYVYLKEQDMKSFLAAWKDMSRYGSMINSKFV